MSQPIEMNMQAVVQRIGQKLSQAQVELAMNEAGVEQLSHQLSQANSRVAELETQLKDAEARIKDLEAAEQAAAE